MKRALFPAVVAVTGFVACSSSEPSSAVPADCLNAAAAPLSNQDIFNRLGETCKSCHGIGASKPYFSSVSAFEQQLAYSSKWVVKGSPESSALLALLRGQGTGAYPQMPLGGESFEALAASGATKITMSELESWIQNLPAPGQVVPREPISSIQRITAEQLLSTFDEALGIAADELIAGNQIKQPKALPVQSPDSIEPITMFNPYDGYIGNVVTRFTGLGGPFALAGRARMTTLTPTAFQMVVQMSQARCRYAVTERKPAIFRDAAPGDGSKSNPDAIRKNIGQLHLRILGEPATTADIDALFANVFIPYEATSVDAAWTGVCAALFRDPLAMSL